MAGDGRPARTGRSRPHCGFLALASIAVLGALSVASACGAADDGVRPLAGGDRSRPASAGAATAGAERTAEGGPATPPTSPAASTTAPPAPAAPVDGPAAIVQDVLARYDRVVTELHGDPSAFLRGGDPLLAEWAAVVPPGAVLADDVRTAVLGRLSRGEAIPVVDGALAYVHHARSVHAESPDRLTFDWCGWSPGVVRDVASGAVVDDGVGASRGTGVVERVDGGWVLSSLDQTELEVLAPGSPDPCPTGDAGS